MYAFVFVASSMVYGGEKVVLFDGKDFSAWDHYLADAQPAGKGKKKKKGGATKKAAFDDVWSIKENTIICKGQPAGYLISKQEFDNFELELEWRFPPGSKGGNSGVFVFTNGPDKIWPKGVEAQLMSGQAGDFWLVDGHKLDVPASQKDGRSDRHYFRTIKDGVEKPIGEWNKYVIRCKDGDVRLTINGKVINEGKSADPKKGKILLQSEGAEIHFRNVVLTTMN